MQYGDVRFIALFRRGEIAGFTLVDASDFEALNRYKWWRSRNRRGGYVESESRGKRLVMHRMLCESDTTVDHINGDQLDNRRSNLRPATIQQNSCNRGPAPSNTSGFKGVSWERNRNKWRGSIKVHGKSIFLGHFDTPEEAHQAYCEAAKRLHGEFARTA